MRGERGDRENNAIIDLGSSPHARGTQVRIYRIHVAARFIPACAGNARCLISGLQQQPVHPRMRGERFVAYMPADWISGSSPHARGTRADNIYLSPEARFIPACAGNARAWPAFISRRPVHPRMRGERSQLLEQTTVHGGSSPHARGTRIPGCLRAIRHRFIPACAGNA